MKAIDLIVSNRGESGKGPAYRARHQKKVPAVLYGPHMDKAMNVVLDEIQLGRAIKGAHLNSIFKLTNDTDKDIDGKYAMMKGVQTHPVTDRRMHVDLYEVRSGEEVKIKVPLVTTGKAKGVKNGGVLQQARRTMAIKCLPKNIPDELSADVSGLDVNDAIHVNDLSLPEGVSVVAHTNFTVVTVVPPDKVEKLTTETSGEEAPLEPTVAGAKTSDDKKEG